MYEVRVTQKQVTGQQGELAAQPGGQQASHRGSRPRRAPRPKERTSPCRGHWKIFAVCKVFDENIMNIETPEILQREKTKWRIETKEERKMSPQGTARGPFFEKFMSVEITQKLSQICEEAGRKTAAFRQYTHAKC